MRSSKFQRCRIDMTGHKVKDRSGLLLYRYVDLVDEREKEKVLYEIKDIEKKWQEKQRRVHSGTEKRISLR